MIFNSVIHAQFFKWILLKQKKRHQFQNNSITSMFLTIFTVCNFKNNTPKNKKQSDMLIILCIFLWV